jgi:hypothetical protein
VEGFPYDTIDMQIMYPELNAERHLGMSNNGMSPFSLSHFLCIWELELNVHSGLQKYRLLIATLAVLDLYDPIKTCI